MAEAGGDPSAQRGPRKAAGLCGDKDEQRNGAAPPDASGGLAQCSLRGRTAAAQALPTFFWRRDTVFF